MFSMKGKYVKGEDLTKAVNSITDLRGEIDVYSADLKDAQIDLLLDLNLIDGDQEAYMRSIVNKVRRFK